MEYAIVDIETTGGYAASNDITEIAIYIHDGKQVIDQYSTLIRPRRAIPYHIQVLTGIQPAMVEDAPYFEEVAATIYEWLQNRIFVAHNVNFDYSFVKHHLKEAGYILNVSKVCTVRLSKKVFPGHPSYSLGNICKSLDIPVYDRHRAGGDAAATAQLFGLILHSDGDQYLQQMLKKGAKEQWLPLHLSPDVIDNLPYTPGVYYFLDQKGKILYIGKAKNLKYRIKSHFTHNGAGKQRQEFLRNIHNIEYEVCGTELMAFILESIEIKKKWPPYNQSQKKPSVTYGIFDYEDRNGYIHLVIDKVRKGIQPLFTFGLLVEGHRLLKSLIEMFQLCPKLCYIQTQGTCESKLAGQCYGACEGEEPAIDYNQRVQQAVDYLQDNLPTYMISDLGKNREEQSVVLMEKGRFYGMGYVPKEINVGTIEDVKTFLTTYPDNDYIRSLIVNFADKNPHKLIRFSDKISLV
jgi:DNA polymerase-3 subunit epsilon